MRVLVVSNMAPERLAPGARPGRSRYPAATRALRRLLSERRSTWSTPISASPGGASGSPAPGHWLSPSTAPSPHPVTGHLSRWLTPRLDLVACVSRALCGPEDGRPGLTPRPGHAAVLPCGADLQRFRPLPRADARRTLGLDPAGRYLFFAASPSRPVKRFDRAQRVASLTSAELLHADGISPADLPLWMNAANAVLVPSDNEGFGLVAVEAAACDVPVLSTPVGVAATLLGGLEGCLVARFDERRWAEVARAHLDREDPRVDGRARAEWYSAELMAGRVLVAYRELLAPAEAA